jgi:hypothetical protein
MNVSFNDVGKLLVQSIGTALLVTLFFWMFAH